MDKYKTFTLEELKEMEIPLGRAEDLTGFTSSRLTALFRVKYDGMKGTHWACRCSCGRYCIASITNLKYNQKKSCGNCEKNSTIFNYKWDLNTMNEFCIENAPGYSILEIDRCVDKSGYHRLKALVKCPNPSHDPYWVDWQHFVGNRRRCKMCYYEENNKESWDKNKAYNYFLKYGFRIINIDEFNNSSSSIHCMGNDGFIYYMSLTTLRNYIKNNGDYQFSKFHTSNKYSLYNVNRFCILYRPDYRIVSSEYRGTTSIYDFKYVGEELDSSIDPHFSCSLCSFLERGAKHPAFHINSIGENNISEILISNNIPFIPQMKFNDCRFQDTNAIAKFDFYILIEHPFVCEFDGPQHEFYTGSGWNTKENHEKTVEHDHFKNNYCFSHGIPIKRIPYSKRDTMTLEDIMGDEFLLDPQQYWQDEILTTAHDYTSIEDLEDLDVYYQL